MRHAVLAVRRARGRCKPTRCPLWAPQHTRITGSGRSALTSGADVPLGSGSSPRNRVGVARSGASVSRGGGGAAAVDAAAVSSTASSVGRGGGGAAGVGVGVAAVSCSRGDGASGACARGVAVKLASPPPACARASSPDTSSLTSIHFVEPSPAWTRTRPPTRFSTVPAMKLKMASLCDEHEVCELPPSACGVCAGNNWRQGVARSRQGLGKVWQAVARVWSARRAAHRRRRNALALRLPQHQKRG